MSNFQRTRSKVWWGDSPPNIVSPVTQQSDWNPNNPSNEDQNWKPQSSRWLVNQIDEQENNSAQNVAQPDNVRRNVWPLRHGSPSSRKSLDSGFSDSDSSPPPSQHYLPSETDSSKNTSSNSSEPSNVNITVKEVIIPKISSESIDVVDNSRMPDNNSSIIPIPKPRLRSSSVIQTPYDLQMYYEIHNDEEHMELLKDKNAEDISKTEPEYPAPKNINKNKLVKEETLNNISSKSVNSKFYYKMANNKEMKITSPNNISNKENSPINSENETKDTSTKNLNVISPSKKYPVEKSFISSMQSDSTKTSKIAKVKDLETGKNKSDENLEYIMLSDNNEIAVINQPRIRTPISNVSYVPTKRISLSTIFRRSMSNSDDTSITTTSSFQRNKLNKSLNLEAHQLDQQILDIQKSYHHHGNGIDGNTLAEKYETRYNKKEIHKPTKAILGKNVKDSLHLKPAKKASSKARQRMTQKTKKIELFRHHSTKKEKPIFAGAHDEDVLKKREVSSLDLPRVCEQNSWVIVGYPEQEVLISGSNEKLVATNSDINLRAENVADNVKNISITPPPSFQDKQMFSYETDSKSLTVTPNAKEKQIKDYGINFDNLELSCMSTPKMLTPCKYSSNVQTPKSTVKNTSKVKFNNFDDLDNNLGLILNNQNEILYRERAKGQTILESLCEKKPESVQNWLWGLVGSYEDECMTTLQSKPLGTEMNTMVSASSATITCNIKKVQTHGQIIVHQYSDVIRHIESNEVKTQKKLIEEQICLLVANINEFVLAHSITLNTKPPGETPERWNKIKNCLQMYLQQLVDIGEDMKLEMNDNNTRWHIVQKYIYNLMVIFMETTKTVLIQQIKTLVSIIEYPPSDMLLKSTLTSISHLAMLSDSTESSLHEKCVTIMKSITELPFVDCGVPRALLTAIIESNKNSIKALSLRALATICVTGEAVKQFEEGGGIEILSDILSDPSNPEPQMREVITVLTQITAPWLRGHYDLTQLHVYLNNIVKNITDILSRTECCQLLLLCTACLVNLVRELELEVHDKNKSKANSDIVKVITEHRTVERLLHAVKTRGPSISVFLQEQTASLLASLSRVPRCVFLLTGLSSVSVALVCFTRSAPAHAPRAAELRAQARLHCHAAEAICRLSVVPDFANQIVQLEGVPLLIRLVRMQRTRPHVNVNPDQTLIDCLNALRTIYKYNPEAFNDYQEDVDNMIRPHLMKSLLLYSAKQESYV